MKIIHKILIIIKHSLYKEVNNGIPEGAPSSSRMFGYIMMLIILFNSFVVITGEVINIITSYRNSSKYVIDYNFLLFLSMLLVHQLTLLGIYKGQEKSLIKQSEQKIKEKENQ